MLDEPQVIKHGNKYRVKMKAEAPSINLIKAHIETEIAPIVGSEQQAQDPDCLYQGKCQGRATMESGIPIFSENPLNRLWRTVSGQGVPDDGGLPAEAAGYSAENYQ